MAAANPEQQDIEVIEHDSMECIEITGTFRVTHFEMIQTEEVDYGHVIEPV